MAELPAGTERTARMALRTMPSLRGCTVAMTEEDIQIEFTLAELRELCGIINSYEQEYGIEPGTNEESSVIAKVFAAAYP